MLDVACDTLLLLTCLLTYLPPHLLRHLRGGHDAGASEHKQDTLVVRYRAVTHPAAVEHQARHSERLHRLRQPHLRAERLLLQPGGRGTVSVDLDQNVAGAALPVCQSVAQRGERCRPLQKGNLHPKP